MSNFSGKQENVTARSIARGSLFPVLLVLSLVLVACGGASTTEERPATESNGGAQTAAAPGSTEAAQEGVASSASDQATVSDKATYTITAQGSPAAKPGATPDATAAPKNPL